MEVGDIIALLKEGKVMEALENAEEVADKRAMAEALTEFAGTLNHLKGKWDLTEALLKQSLLLHYELAATHYNLGVLFSSPEMLDADEANAEKAIKAYKNAIRISPDFNEARHNLGMLMYFTGDLEGAKDQYEKIVADIGDSKTYRHLGMLLLEEKRKGRLS